ncbi:hypothetical protein HWV62_31431 [Athelia sp. TMB]|nr:hypothetical protein HWV62_31431 [Athelia sp. TMB]
MRRHRSKASKNAGRALPHTTSSLELEKRAPARPRRPKSAESATGQPPTYMQMMMSLQNTGSPHPPIPSSSTYTASPKRRSSVRKPPSVYLAEEEGEDEKTESQVSQISVPNFLVPDPDEHVEMRRISRGISPNRRPISMDSVSVYSSASVPLDALERNFQPLALDTPPVSAPAWGSSSMGAQQNQAIFMSRQVTTIREELAPETYTKAQPIWKVPPPSQLLWKAQPTPNFSRSHVASDATDIAPPVPPLPEILRDIPITRPSPVALRVIPDFSPSPIRHSVQEWSETSASPDAPALPPGLSFDPPSIEITSPEGKGKRRASDASSSSSPIGTVGPPPGLPPRSPLRPSVENLRPSVS